MARDYIHKTIDPNNPSGTKIDVIIPGNYYDGLHKHYPVAYQNLITAKYVLDNPEIIFFGVRKYSQGGWCYIGKPEQWYIRENVIAPLPRDIVFAVYLNPLMRVYEIRGERTGGDCDLYPLDWRNRYRGLVWKNTS